MKLTVLSDLKLSMLKAPYGAVLQVQELNLEQARRLIQRHGAEMPRPPPYRADRVCDALELPPELGTRIVEGQQFLVCECQGFRAVLFYLVTFSGDLEPEEENETTIDPFGD